MKKLLALPLICLIVLAFCACAPPQPTPPEPPLELEPEPPGIKNVEVSTVEELVAAIASDTCITLRSGLYDLSTEGVGGLVVENITGLTLQAAEGAAVEIVTPDISAPVLSFVHCDNVSLYNIGAGHLLGDEEECEAAVVILTDTNNITIENGLFYDGGIGLALYNCATARIKNLPIYECTLYGYFIQDCADIDFRNCIFMFNRTRMNLIGIKDSQVTFTDCATAVNKELTSSVVLAYGEVSFDHCSFGGNMLAEGWGNIPVICGEGISLQNCSIIKGDNFSDYWLGATDLGGNSLKTLAEYEAEMTAELEARTAAELKMETGIEGVTATRLRPSASEYQKYQEFALRDRYEYPTEYPLPDGSKLLEGEYHVTLLTAAGEEILLLEGNESDGEAAQRAHVYQMLDDHRFIYFIYGYEWVEDCGVYDLRDFQQYSFDPVVEHPLLVTENTLFSVGDAQYAEEFNLAKTDLTTFQTELLLPDLSWGSYSYAISPDGKFFATTNFEEYNNYRLDVFSLESEELLFSLPLGNVYNIDFCSPTQLIAYNDLRFPYSENDARAEIIVIDIED